MTVGTRTVTQPHFAGHTEAILYRTRTEILTDQRILLDGTAYTFDQIEAVDVVRLKFYIPFQIARALALIGTVMLAWTAFTSLRQFAFISLFMYGLLAVALGVFVFMSTSIVPSHAVRLTVGGKRIYMMHDTSVPYLERVKKAVQQGMSRV